MKLALHNSALCIEVGSGGWGDGAAVFPCSAGGMEDRMKSSQSRQANPKAKERRTERSYACPVSYPLTQHKAKVLFSLEEMEKGQERYDNSCPFF